MSRRPTKWVLVANGNRACVLAIEGRDKVSLLTQHHAESPPTRDLVSDRPGRSFDRMGAGRHAMEPPSDAHRRTKVVFVQEIATYLDRARQRNHFQQLIVIAAPATLGVLRKNLAKPVLDAIVREIPVDLTHYRIDQLPEYLKKLENR